MADITDKRVSSPLTVYGGEPPPAPQWFKDAVTQEPERSFVEVKGARIECLAWGERGKPGMIFVHGASAHADWWSFIAPFFAEEYRVAAVSLSGMGRSGWRETYDYLTFLEEIDACAHATGLYEADIKPVYVGHSMGGATVYVGALKYPERMSATIMIDNGFGRAPPREAAKEDVRPLIGAASGRVYPTLAEALARFRFMPLQTAECDFAVDLIARRSLKEATDANGVTGWSWCFDPLLFPKLDRSAFVNLPPSSPGPAVHLYGDRSDVIKRAKASGMFGKMDPSVVQVVIPDAGHHIMVDQPLALISAMRAALGMLPRA